MDELKKKEKGKSMFTIKVYNDPELFQCPRCGDAVEEEGELCQGCINDLRRESEELHQRLKEAAERGEL